MLAAAIQTYFLGNALDGVGPFRRHIGNFLLFDHVFVTDPSEFTQLLTTEKAGVYVGYLVDPKLSSILVVPEGCFYIQAGAEFEDVRNVFEQTTSVRDGPISASVNSGFVIPESFNWGLWFSTFWEVAIAGSSSSEVIANFRRSNSHIHFMTDDIVHQYYSSNPFSEAPALLQRYRQGNLAV
jgi:hypothetical protein